jgi:hypothetical protein
VHPIGHHPAIYQFNKKKKRVRWRNLNGKGGDKATDSCRELNNEKFHNQYIS